MAHEARQRVEQEDDDHRIRDVRVRRRDHDPHGLSAGVDEGRVALLGELGFAAHLALSLDHHRDDETARVPIGRRHAYHRGAEKRLPAAPEPCLVRLWGRIQGDHGLPI